MKHVSALEKSWVRIDAVGSVDVKMFLRLKSI